MALVKKEVIRVDDRQNSAINWYPGHMTKTYRMMEKQLSVIDAVIHLLDARIVQSSQNPDFDTLFKHKKRIYVLNKTDLANPNVTEKWIRQIGSDGTPIIAVNSSDGKGIQKVLPTIRAALSEKIERYAAKGMKKSMRIMVTGIPNVGKSTFINRVAGRKVAIAQDRPGVTRSKQWVPLGDGIDLMDTPGMLWPKFENQQTGMFLAFTGAINDNILDKVELVFEFIKFMSTHYPENICDRFKISEDITSMEPLSIYDLICKKRGFLISGGEYDYERAAAVILDEFRAGKLGRVSFEEP